MSPESVPAAAEVKSKSVTDEDKPPVVGEVKPELIADKAKVESFPTESKSESVPSETKRKPVADASQPRSVSEVINTLPASSLSLPDETKFDSDAEEIKSESGKALTPPSEQGDDEQPKIPSLRFWLLCIGVCLGLFLAMIDASIVATSLYSIGTEFNDIANVNWVALAYTLAYMGCAVVFSRISDIIGRRDAFVAAYVIFVAFSLACGWSKNMHQLIAFRALQGIGGSGLYSLTMIMLPEMSPTHLLQHIGAMIGFVVAMAGVLGPVLGGLLTNYTSWRWVFWINGPVGAVSMIIFFLSWPKKEHLPVWHKHSWKQLDYPGAFLTIAAAVLVVFSFQNAGGTSGRTLTSNNWSSIVFIAPLVLGVVCWFALFAWQYLIEHKLSAHFSPIFPIRLFRHGLYTSGVINTLLLGFPFLLLIYVVPLRIQVVGGKSALLAGVMLLPMLITVAIGSVVSGAINGKKPMIAESLLIGSCLMLIGCGLLTTMSTHELDAAKLLGFITFCGLGFGLTVSSSTMIASYEVHPKDFASAQGILAQLRILGGSLGIAASTAILRKEMNGAAMHAAKRSAEQIAAADQQRVRETYAKAFRIDLTVATIISGVAVLITIIAYLQGRKRPKKQERQRTKPVQT